MANSIHRTHLVVAVMGAGIAAGGGVAVARTMWMHLTFENQTVPTIVVTRGDLTIDVYAPGEVRTLKTMMLTTPAVGTQMRILSLKRTGAIVSAGEVVLTLDPAEQRYRLDEQQSFLAGAEAEISQASADGAAQRARDRVNLVIAQSKLRKAELDVAGNEFLGAIEARKRELTLEEARRRLAQLQQDVAFHKSANDAVLAAAVQKRDKSRLLMEDAQAAIESMTLRAPMSGVVSVQGNLEGNYYIGTGAIPEYREGDTISGSRAVAEILDIARLEVVTHVPETSIASIKPGQHALVTLNAGFVGSDVLQRSVDAVVTFIGDISSPRLGEQPSPVRKVDVLLQFTGAVKAAKPGMTARVAIEGARLKDVVSIPRQAVFDRDGESYVFLKTGDRFVSAPIKISARTDSVVVVRDIAEGSVIALVDPQSKARSSDDAIRGAAPPKPQSPAPFD